MKEEPIYLTKEGYNKYLEELRQIQSMIESNARKKSGAYRDAVGDGWHDNFAFEEATREERRLLGLLREKRAGLRRIEIVEDIDREEDIVNLDDFVLVDFVFSETDREEELVHLIGSTGPDFGKEYTEVTINSPLGKSIYKQKIGSTVHYSVNDRDFTIFIKEKVLNHELGR